MPIAYLAVGVCVTIAVIVGIRYLVGRIRRM